MRGDIARQTFRADKHYSGVVMQQGRVQLDADWNEQLEIGKHRDRLVASDLVGGAGAPKTAPGFAVTPASPASDLTIGRGRFYLDGVVCENDADVPFSAQPDLRSTDGGSLLPSQDGLYVAYLEAWERHITALEDEAIKETALGGPDTATRTRTIWQVRLLKVADPGGTITPETPFAEWTDLLQRNHVDAATAGTMRAQSQPQAPSPDPLCVLPPGAGYRRLENQLYRVEVHHGGDRSQARFKWSRDNGTVASRIESNGGGVITGSVIHVAEMGKDGLLTFASDPLPEWLELTDDRYELAEQHGQLARVQSVDPATRQITFAAGTLSPLDAGQHPIVRRWDQAGDTATADGVAMTGNWQDLEDGVQVRFEPGTYRVGDYWLIPARTAVGLETGTVEWPRDGGTPRAVPPVGTRHRFARLALVRRAGGTFSLVPGGDCRRAFPPLTAIEAVDVGFSDAVCRFGGDVGTVQEALDVLCQRSVSICNLLVGPGEDLATAIGRLSGVQDALICLRAGTYTLNAPIVLEGLGHIQVTGAGPGTRVVAPGAEAALQFRACASVKVSNLSVESGALVARRGDRAGLDGTLTFDGCKSVTVEGVRARCAGGPVRAGTCITVRHAAPTPDTRAVIRGNELEAGHFQTGLLVINVERSVVADNLVRAGARPSDDVLLADAQFRGALRRQLITGIVHGGDPPAGTNATVTVGPHTVHFRTDLGLMRQGRDSEWQRLVSASVAPASVTSPRLLGRILLRMASEILRTGGTASTATMRTAVQRIIAQDAPVAGQGIVVGGELAAEARVSGNTVLDVVQGVHVGLAAKGSPPASSRSAGVVSIEDNNVRVSLPSSTSRARHGIYCGSVDSLVIDSNRITLSRNGRNIGLRTEAIRLFGTFGRRVIVRHNHMGAQGTASQFTVGVTFAPLNTPLPAQPMWIVTENEMESSTNKVDVPAGGPKAPGPADPNGVRSRIRGLADNFS